MDWSAVKFEWLLYAAVVMTGLFGSWLLYAALWRDRARGRRRCPKCWYDMSGIPGALTCSECGKTVKRERQLCKTRRRWRRAAMALLVLAVTAAAALAPTVRREGAIAVTPTTVLVLIAPCLDTSQNSGVPFAWPAMSPGPQTFTTSQRLSLELCRRIDEGRLAGWHWRWLIARFWNDDTPPWIITLRTRSEWPAAHEVCLEPVVVYRPDAICWLGQSELRVRVEPKSGRANAAPCVLGGRGGMVQRSSALWQEPLVECGQAKPGTVRVRGRAIVERLNHRGTNAEQWMEIWSGPIQADVQVVAEPKSMPKPVDDPAIGQRLAELTRVQVDTASIGIRWSRTTRANEVILPTLGLRFDLLCDETVVATASGWWTTEYAQERSPSAFVAVPSYARVEWENPVSDARWRAAAEHSWSVRVRSDTALAVRDFRSTRYWHGEFIIPLKWNEKDGYLSDE